MAGYYGQLPGDFALDALSTEALRRGKRMGRADYSYGKLVADTTQEERERIVDTYRAESRKRKARTISCFLEADQAGTGG